MKFSTWLAGLSEDLSPDVNNDFLVIYDDDSATSKKIAIATIVTSGSGIPLDGWIASAAMTYAGADDPTYTVTISGDVTDIYFPGMRIKLTQSTGGTKYFIITKASYSAPDTTLTLYGGTDYDLANEAISDPYYSSVKAPAGFPLDPSKWTVETKNSSANTQASPTANIWYNIGSITISVPIGIWFLEFHTNFQVNGTGAASGTAGKVTLSTANNSESDTDFTSFEYTIVGSTNITRAMKHHNIKVISLAAKTTYYLNGLTIFGAASIYFDGTAGSILIRARCAYL